MKRSVVLGCDSTSGYPQVLLTILGLVECGCGCGGMDGGDVLGCDSTCGYPQVLLTILGLVGCECGKMQGGYV